MNGLLSSSTEDGLTDVARAGPETDDRWTLEL
jgi:hypothetical protein